MKTEITYIYSIDCPVTGSPVYIGRSSNPSERIRKHIEDSLRRKNKSKKAQWICEQIAYGKRPKMSVLTCVKLSDCDFWESFYIGYFKMLGFKLLNSNDGGFGGRYDTDVRKKMSAARIGKTTSDNHKRAVALSSLGNKYAIGNKNRAKEISCIDVLTCSINYYESTADASRKLNVISSAIGNNLANKTRLVSKRYAFTYVK